MKPIRHCIRDNPKKGKAFVERNWRPREEIAKELAAQKQKMLEKLNKPTVEPKSKSKKIELVRQPQKDMCDFHMEEKHGIYFVGEKMAKVRFPR